MLIESREDAPNFPNQTPGVWSPGDDDLVTIMSAGTKMRTPRSCHYWYGRVRLMACWNPTNINTAIIFGMQRICGPDMTNKQTPNHRFETRLLVSTFLG